MSYEKQNFVNDQILTADHLNHIENGIINLDNVINELNNAESFIKEETGYEFLQMKDQDIADLLQQYIDNGITINLPSNCNFICSKPVIVKNSVLIHGNNSNIKFTYDGERGLFERDTEASSSLACYDLSVEVQNDQIAYDFRLVDSSFGTHIRLYNCTIRGNINNTKGVLMTRGVLMTQNDFSCIKDTKFWYVSYPISCKTTQRDNTQILLENIGISNCKIGVEIEQSDKVSLFNVDIANCDIGFKILGRNKRLKFLNCHVEYFSDTGYHLGENTNSIDIIFENCSVMYDSETSNQGFYCGVHSLYLPKGIKFINCNGDHLTYGTKIFDIRCAAVIHGDIHMGDNFVSWNDSYVNTKIIFDNDPIPYKEQVIEVNETNLKIGDNAGTLSYTEGEEFDDITFQKTIYIEHRFDAVGYYEINYNAYNSGDTVVFLALQENGGNWDNKFNNIRLNTNKSSQKLIVYIPTPATYRVVLKSYATTDSNIKIKNIIIKGIKMG